MKATPYNAGAGLQSLRESRGLTRTALAYHLGISERALQSYELADRRLSVKMLVAIAGYFGLSLDETYAVIYGEETGATNRTAHTV